jgi:hypothetical protein
MAHLLRTLFASAPPEQAWVHHRAARGRRRSRRQTRCRPMTSPPHRSAPCRRESSELAGGAKQPRRPASRGPATCKEIKVRVRVRFRVRVRAEMTFAGQLGCGQCLARLAACMPLCAPFFLQGWPDCATKLCFSGHDVHSMVHSSTANNTTHLSCRLRSPQPPSCRPSWEPAAESACRLVSAAAQRRRRRAAGTPPADRRPCRAPRRPGTGQPSPPRPAARRRLHIQPP